MQAPLVHLGGTSKANLLNDLGNASYALLQAEEALCLAAPNGRDYYPLGPSAIQIAEQEHKSRLDRLKAIKKEIDELAMEVSKQGR